MLGRKTRTAAVALAAPLAVLLSAGNALAGPSPNLSFSASHDGASAGWSHGKGSAINLTVGSDFSTTYAAIVFHHLPSTTVDETAEPHFATSNYNAGSPRFYVTLDNGDSLWGYPGIGWAINNGNTSESWTQVQSDEAGASVTGAEVIADGESSGVTDVITGLTFNGITFN